MEKTENSCGLADSKCKPCEGGVPPMTDAEIAKSLKEVDGWEFTGGVIKRAFGFKDHYEVMAFLNAIAWISNREGHHPDIRFGYNTCEVSYSTHAIGGLSENDFICAAKVNRLLE